MEKISVLTQAIARDVESLPHFPETILELIRLTEEPRSTVAADRRAHRHGPDASRRTS